MNEEYSATELLTYIEASKVNCEKEVNIAKAVERLHDNKDFQVLLKDFDDLSVILVKQLAYVQSKENAADALKGIAAFHEILDSYPAKRKQAEAGLVNLEEERKRIFTEVYTSDNGE